MHTTNIRHKTGSLEITPGFTLLLFRVLKYFING